MTYYLARLSMRHMMLLLSVVFILPIVVITTTTIGYFRSDIAIAGLERAGGDYVAAMLPVMRRQIDGAADQALIARFRAATDPVDARLDSGVLKRQWLATREDDVEVANMAARDLIDHIANRSRLVLDAQLDSYYLVDVGLMKSPMLGADLASLAAAVNRVSRHADVKDRRFLTTLRGAIESQRVALQEAVGQARDAGIARGDRQIATVLAPRFDAVEQQLMQVVRDIEALDRVYDRPVGRQAMLPRMAADVRAARLGLIDAQASALTLFGGLVRNHERDIRHDLYFALARMIAASSMTLLLAVAILYHLTRSAQLMMGRMRGLAEGELVSPIPFSGGSSELGQIAESLTILRANLVERERLSGELTAAGERLNRTVQDISARNAALEAEAEAQRRRAAAGEREAREALITDLKQTIGQILSGLLSRAGVLGEEADMMSSNAAASRAEAETAEYSTRNALDGVMIVATAIDQLANANGQIRQLMQEVSVSVDRTMTSVDGAQSRIEGLESASDRIGEVIELIAQIASQTRLLALNASIEAARAGDAGNGFAVVASEVKALAGRAAAATRDVEQHIEQIRNEARLTIASIEDIGLQINKVADHALLVASAVEQQTAAAGEIAVSAAAAAQATSSTSDAVAIMAATAAQAHESAQTMRTVANDVTEQADRLKLDVDHFVARVA